MTEDLMVQGEKSFSFSIFSSLHALWNCGKATQGSPSRSLARIIVSAWTVDREKTTGPRYPAWVFGFPRSTIHDLLTRFAVRESEARIHIIGVGSDGLAGLTGMARSCLNAADILYGAAPVLALLPELHAERRILGADLQEMVTALESEPGQKKIAIVVAGDPLFYGVARYLCERVGKEAFEVIPHVSMMQLAFARVKETWDEAYLTDLQTHPLDTVVDRIRSTDTVGLFTSEREGPQEVARQLLARGIDYFRAYVCENLGAPDERVTQGELSDIQEMEFAPLNVLILKRKPGHPDQPVTPSRYRRFGNPDSVFAQSRPQSGLITQAEVRAIALGLLGIQSGSVVWDIGAGSGSVAVEAAQLSQPGMVYAIEQDATDYHLILANAEQLGVHNLKAIHGTAPAVLLDLPAPDAIFVGGTGHEIARLLEAAWKALRPLGHLVVNVATLQSLHTTHTVLRQLAGHAASTAMGTLPSLSAPAQSRRSRVEVLLVQISRGTEQLETLRFEAANPTFLLHVHKQE
jgi:precorrin-6Y C5,15-methyltransferase (decarboxylating)